MALADNLVYFHSFEEDLGYFADRLGAMNLAKSGSPTIVPGRAGNGVDFTGGSYAFQNSNAVLQTGNIDCSWALWAKPRSVPASNCALFAKADEYELLYFSGETLLFQVKSGGSFPGVGTGPISGAYFQPNAWNLVVCVHDAAIDKVKISLNGSPFNEGTALSGGITPSAGQFRVGSGGSSVDPYDGGIDELGFWKNRALTAADVQELWNGGNGLAWPFTRAPASGNLLTRRAQNVPKVPFSVGKTF